MESVYSNSFKIFSISVLLSTLTVQAHAGLKFTDPGRRLGCGTVSEVKEVAQKPLYDHWYQDRFAGSPEMFGSAVQLSAGGLIGAGVVAAVALLDAAVASPREKEQWVMPETKELPNVQSVRITMDGGRSLYLPLLKRDALNGVHRPYVVGRRVQVYYHEVGEGKTFSLFNGIQPPTPDKKPHQWHCNQALSEEVAERAYVFGENLAK